MIQVRNVQIIRGSKESYYQPFNAKGRHLLTTRYCLGAVVESVNDKIDRMVLLRNRARIRLLDKNPALIKALDKLIDLLSRGDPVSLLRLTCKSTY